MSATMSLLGMYEFDDSLFDGFNYPSEFTPTDRNTLIDNLLMDTAELELLYPDARFMAIAIRAWSRKELTVWEKLYKTTVLEYNPIWNKDGKIIETVTGTHKTEGTDDTKRTDAYTDTTENNTSQNLAHTGNTGTNTIHKVSGYNMESGTATDWEQSDISESSANDTSSGSSAGTLTHNASESDLRTAKESGETSEERTRVEQGNIGVTTTQAMIREERDIDKFNLMDYIIDSFIKRFCLLVY